MPTRENAPAGAPCWVDLMTSDTERSASFYTELFGWTAEAPNVEFGGYFNFLKDGVHIAGCMSSQMGLPDVWSVYLNTDDPDEAVELAVSNGGQVQIAPMAVGELGTMAVLADPSGASIGMWKPGQHRGFGILGEPGAPSWFELHSRNYQAALPFYQQVFGWETRVVSDSDDFRYSTLQDGEESLGGVMDSAGFLPEGVPSHWAVYFGSADTDASLAKVAKLGGKVLEPAQDTPYGRLATVADPTGAQFRLIAGNA
jgi:predicted enzyme related to lactoylglutathione lyase